MSNTPQGEAIESNAAEKDLVNRLVNDINGLKSVNNRMTIDKIVRMERKG